MSVPFASELLLVPPFGHNGKPNLATKTIPSKSSAVNTKEPTMIRGNFQPDFQPATIKQKAKTELKEEG